MKQLASRHMLLQLLLVGALDGGLWLCIMQAHLNSSLAVSGFLAIRVCCAGLVFGIITYYTRAETFNAKIVGALAAIFLYIGSVFGLLGIVVILRKHVRHALQSGHIYHIDHEEGDMPEKDGKGESQGLDIQELLHVAPLADGMTDERKEIRVAAVLAMEEIMNQPDADSIRTTLIESGNDPAKEVQFYAHEALKKMSDEYTEAIKRLMDIVNTSSAPDYETYKALADLYAQFADAKTEHPLLIKFYRQEAAKYYAHILEHYPQERHVILQQFIPALYQNKDYNRCIEYCESVQQEPELTSLAVLYKARCLFDTRKIAELTQFARQMAQSGDNSMKDFLILSEEHGDG